MTEKEIKNKLKSISDTVKITKAMQVLSTTRTYRTGQRQEFALAFFNAVDQAVNSMLATESKDNPLFHPGDGVVGLVVIAGDKGLCGDYNHQILKVADDEIAALDKCKIYTVGFVAREYYRNKGVRTDGSFVYVISEPTPKDAKKMAEGLITAFKENKLNKVKIVYSRQVGSSCQVVTETLLPYESKKYAQKQQGTNSSENSFDQKVAVLGNVNIDSLLFQHLSSRLYYMLTAASNSVNYKRMLAMKQATTNGEEMVEELTLQYNRTRQNKITNELNDAVAVIFGKNV